MTNLLYEKIEMEEKRTPLRLGRRDSESHAAEVTYLHDVLTTNFLESRTTWDLHHHFFVEKGLLKGKKIDLLFDIAFFKDLKIPYTLESYKAWKHGGRIPDMVINILSERTWKEDISETVDICRDLGVFLYAVFSPYKVTDKNYHPPFLRAYILQEGGSYKKKELRTITMEEGATNKINIRNVIDVSGTFPFHLGLMKLKQQHEGELSRFRLIFIDPFALKILLTSAENAEVPRRE